MSDSVEPATFEQPQPRWPQFGMRSLFVFVTLCCVLFALAGVLGRLWALALAWMMLITAVHVAGNVWGTRLRKRRPPRDARDEEWPQRGDPPFVTCPPATRLRERAALGWIGVATGAVCAMAGGVLGTSALLFVGWGEMGYPSLVVGAVSGMVIGGFAGFLASSFLEVALRAWTEALGGSRLSACGCRPEEGRLSAVSYQLSAREEIPTAGQEPIAESLQPVSEILPN
jgi:hypothetical protein